LSHSILLISNLITLSGVKLHEMATALGIDAASSMKHSHHAHGALGDATITVRILQQLWERHPQQFGNFRRSV
jgi:hypothetical protein